jgi:hypothetical protein
MEESKDCSISTIEISRRVENAIAIFIFGIIIFVREEEEERGEANTIYLTPKV